MKAAYIQKGESLDYKNDTDTVVSAGDVVIVGSRAGVAGTTIPAGGTGSIHMVGVYKFPKNAAEAIAMGVEVYYTEDGITAVGTGNVLIGYAAAAAAENDLFVTVRLQG